MEGFIFSQSGQTIQEILTYVEQRLPGTLQALEKAIGDEAIRATNKEDELARTLIPKSEKGAANGVASLNGGGQVPNDQLQWSLRGVLNPSDIDSTSLVAGIYQVNGKVLGPGILDGDAANGVMVQYPWGSRVQLLLVGRAGGAAAGEQVEIYVRRYLTGPQRWTEWSKSGGGEVYMVNIMRQGTNYVMDKTYEEIRAAAEGGAVVLATYNNEQYMLGSYDSDSIIFYSMVGNSIISYFYFGYQMPGEYRQINIDPNLLIVTINGQQASHSSTEIVEAVHNGKMPVLKVGNKFFLLYSTYGGVVTFRRMDGLGNIQGYAVDQYNQLAEEVIEESIGHIYDVHITNPLNGQALVYVPEHEEEGQLFPAGWYNQTLPSMSQYEALVARVAALEQNQ